MCLCFLNYCSVSCVQLLICFDVDQQLRLQVYKTSLNCWLPALLVSYSEFSSDVLRFEVARTELCLSICIFFLIVR